VGKAGQQTEKRAVARSVVADMHSGLFVFALRCQWNFASHDARNSLHVAKRSRLLDVLWQNYAQKTHTCETIIRRISLADAFFRASYVSSLKPMVLDRHCQAVASELPNAPMLAHRAMQRMASGTL